MPTAVICPCGERFHIGGRAFPCSIACHMCGARTVLASPMEFAQDDGWALDSDTRPGSTSVSDSRYGAMAASLGSHAASAACAKCGRFYCSHHGRARLNGNSTCVDCYNRLRPVSVLIAILFAPLGVACLLLPHFVVGPQEPAYPYYATFIPLAVGSLLTAALNLWFAFRAYP